MSTQAAIADAKLLGALVNEALEQVDELRDAVRIITAKRASIHARVVPAIPSARFETDFGRQAKIARLHNALDRLIAPLAGLEFKAGRELRDDEITHAVAEIASLTNGDKS